MKKLLFIFILFLGLHAGAQQHITAAEYFIGSIDPGEGNATPLLVSDGNFDEAIEAVFKDSVILNSSGGSFVFNIRMKDQLLQWGPLFKKAFVIPVIQNGSISNFNLPELHINAAEYFLGLNDPGEGNANAMIVFDGAYDEAIETVLKENVLVDASAGSCIFNVRVKDNLNHWGSVFKRAFLFTPPANTTGNLAVIPASLHITAGEYFFGLSDPGQGNATPILAFDGLYDEAVESLLRNSAVWGITSGPNLFNIRIRDNQQHWGPLFKKVVVPQGANLHPNLIREGDTLHVCDNRIATLHYIGPNGYTKLWFNATGADSINFIPTNNGYYTVHAQFDTLNYIDSIYIVVHPILTSLFANDTLAVCGASYNLQANTGAFTYTWNTGAHTTSIAINQTQWYTCTISNNVCSFKDSIFVSIIDTKIAQQDTSICHGNSILLSANNSLNPTLDYTQNFEGSSLPGWSNVKQFGFDGSTLLGPYINESISYQTSNLPFHDSILIEFDFYPHDTWEANEPFQFSVDNVVLTTAYFAYTYASSDSHFQQIAYTPYRCWGWTGYSPIKYHATFKVPHTSNSLLFTINQWNGEFACNESWSIDNFHMSTTSNQQIAWSNSDSSWATMVSPLQHTVYIATITDGVGSCSDSVSIDVDQFAPQLFSEDTLRSCEAMMDLHAGNGYASYHWNTGDTTEVLTVNHTGLYSCTVSNGHCLWTDSMYVSIIHANIIPNDTTICLGSSIQLLAMNDLDATSYYSQNFEGNNLNGWTNSRQFVFDGSQLLGPYLNESISFQQTTLPTHDSLLIEFDFYPHDTWEGNEPFQISLDNVLLTTAYFAYYNPTYDSHFQLTGSASPRCWGYTGYTLKKYHASFRVAHTSGSALFTMNQYNGEYACNESWSIDNFQMNPIRHYQMNWSDLQTGSGILVTPTQNTMYTVSISDGANSCTDSVQVNVHQIIQNFIPQDTITVCGQSEIYTIANGFTSYLWNTSNTTASIPLTSTGFYSCTVSDGICTANDGVMVNVNPSSKDTMQVDVCNSYTWSLNNQTYTNTGLYTLSFVNMFGCDSNKTLQLTVRKSSDSLQTTSAFDSYTWAVNGITYTSSGIYTYSTLNSVGCDSLVTLNLTIYKTSLLMTMTNVVQLSSSSFEYDVILTNTGTTTIGLKGYTCGINHATGMRGTGNLTHTFISRDPLLATLPSVSPGYTASNNHLRFITNTNLNVVNLLPGASIRLATMRVTNSVPYPANFIPDFNLQMVTGVGKTNSGVTCIVSPPGTSYIINGIANTASSGTLQKLNADIQTPCLYLNQSSNFNATATMTSPVTCNGLSNAQVQVILAGNGSQAGTINYSLDGASNQPVNSNPFTVSNLSEGSHTVHITTDYGCTYNAIFNIPQASLIEQTTTISACNQYSWEGNTYTQSGVFTHTYASWAGCDSLSTLNLTLSQSNSIFINDTACGERVWNGFTYTLSGVYTNTFTNVNGCDSIMTLNLLVHPKPIAQLNSVGSTTFCAGDSILLSATNGTGYSYTWYRNSNEITGATSGTYLVSQTGIYQVEINNQFNCTTLSDPKTMTVNACDVTLHLNLFYQGYYASLSEMRPVLYNQGNSSDLTITDTIMIDLHSAHVPYGLIVSKPVILYSNGEAVCTFNHFTNNYYLTDSYYVAIRHRNGLTTWSANPVAFNASDVSYDFSSTNTQAYGDNLVEVESGVWALYSGDLNYDDNIDLLDNPILESDINGFMYGYLASDLNGDGNVDLLDVPTLESNIYSFVFSSQPSWFGTLPSVSTATVNITGSNATSGGINVTDGNTNILDKGICWSINPHPTIAESYSSSGSGVGNYTSNLINLLPNTTYFVRAYVTNEVGTVYGNEISFVTAPLSIGSFYQGGIVFHIFQPGDAGYVAGETHGLIAAPYDQPNATWGCYGAMMNTSNILGSGLQNTFNILNTCTEPGIAARICDNLVVNGYSDWYLPSLTELSLLFTYRNQVGGFSANFYWSSSEINHYSAYELYFYDGYLYSNIKYGSALVRAVRTF